MPHIARLAFALVLAGTADARAQNAGTPAAASKSTSSLSPVDYDFVAQANLGAPFQVDSGRLAERKAGSASLRDCAHLGGKLREGEGHH